MQQVHAYSEFLLNDFSDEVEPVYEEITRRIRDATTPILVDMEDNSETELIVPELKRFTNSLILAETAQIFLTQFNEFKSSLEEQ